MDPCLGISSLFNLSDRKVTGVITDQEEITAWFDETERGRVHAISYKLFLLLTVLYTNIQIMYMFQYKFGVLIHSRDTILNCYNPKKKEKEKKNKWHQATDTGYWLSARTPDILNYHTPKPKDINHLVDLTHAQWQCQTCAPIATKQKQNKKTGTEAAKGGWQRLFLHDTIQRNRLNNF